MEVTNRVRWRLILGNEAEEETAEKIALNEEEESMDVLLQKLYGSKEGGNNSSNISVNRWLGDIRKYFPKETVEIIQKDALEKFGIKKMLDNPDVVDSLVPNVALVTTLLNVKDLLSQESLHTAKIIIRKVVEDIVKKLKLDLINAISGRIDRSTKNNNPKFKEINWNRTIRANLKHYQPDFNTIIPELKIGSKRKSHAMKQIILLVDHSASMLESTVYSAVFSSILATIPAVKTSIILFDTEVVDMTDMINDPIEILLGVNMGGGTHINKALMYAKNKIQNPNDTIMFLISDLYEGPNDAYMVQTIQEIKESGVNFITLLSLNDEGIPSYDKIVASKIAEMDIPCFGCTPYLFPDLFAALLGGNNLKDWASQNNLLSI
jgi:VWA domain containing CoxE-like protein